MKKSGHTAFLDSFVEYAMLKREAKRGAVWLHGAPNSGKTTVLKMLEEIFTVVPFTQTKSKFDLVYE